ncbi:MAG: DUF2786 domain-containing protein [Terriglobales bacterium]
MNYPHLGNKPDISIVEKIKKLLALADGNQNEHEREVAMQFAMDLLAKHNLTISQIEGDFLNQTTTEIEGHFRLEPWIRAVLKAACTLYYTEVYISERLDHRWRKVSVPMFVGTAENIAVTMDVAAWLLDSVRKESNRVYKDQFERRSFRLGAADRIFERALKMIEAEKRGDASTTGTSLMLVRTQLERANQEQLAKLNLRPGRSRSSYLDNDAYADGEAYGTQIGLNKVSIGIR